MSNLTCTSDEPIASSGSRPDVGTMYPQQSFASPHQTQTSAVKRKRNLPGNPDPDAEVIALSPKTLMATNRFLCEVCNKGFQRDQNLQLHRRGHNLPWKLKQRTSKEIKKRVYVCPEVTCVHHDPSRALGDLTGIKKHFSRKHGEKKWKCDKCSKKYAVQSDWKAHSKTCGTREYKCDCGTLFSRRDSFITHRAFCDALAEESAKAITTNPLMSSQSGSSTQHMNLQQQFSNIHDYQSSSIKLEQHQHQYERQQVPQWLSSHQQHSLGDLSSSIFSNRLEHEFSQSHHQQASSTHQNTNLNPSPSTTPSFPPYNPSSSPHMSATALLQKAAQMGATMSSTPASSSSGMLIRPAQQTHMSTNTGNPTTTTSYFGLGLSSHEVLENGFMHSLTAFGNKSTMGQLSAPSLLEEMSTLNSENNAGFAGSSFEEAFGGMLNSKSDSRNSTEHPSKKQKTIEGGGKNDGLTRDFLGLRAFPHRNFLNQCMGSSIPYEQQNQNQKPWQG
ncbi:indeterminate-domain [Thalictrum thalictroides]|uniref:Indeterminate-domain n=1 Tax=Thalictrum thalictroides TaxID=46969 RepID=A0A7J6W262_THATH|nr:indeterminate-domain [Thalictrum thalictroides]